jgi:tRNA pseudouridine38-40 synthase
MKLAYDGTNFTGWAKQPGLRTVQAELLKEMQVIFGKSKDDFGMRVAGRTDAGVHAEAMVAHLNVTKEMAPFRLMEALNAVLRPQPVAILDCSVVSDDWHARFSCTGRRYIYRIVNRRAPLALDQGRAWRVVPSLDHEAMHEAAQIFIGTHDFTTFRSVHCQSTSPVKSIDRMVVRRFGDELEVDVAARSFLHHQVRSMVGCLVLVGEGKWSADDLKGALDAKDRTALGFNAPPDGLYFIEANYPNL